MDTKEYDMLTRLMLSQAPDNIKDELQILFDKVWEKYALNKDSLSALVVSSDLYKFLKKAGLNFPAKMIISKN